MTLKTSKIVGHFLAVFTVIVWGITFVSTKILLEDFSPMEILFFRIAIAVITLFIIYPQKLVLKDKKDELYFALSGFCGVTTYFLCENMAIDYSLASNVSVIVSTAPFFIALLTSFIYKDEKLPSNFYLGFAMAILGIALISFNGKIVLDLNFKGDILALMSAVSWAVYSLTYRKISEQGYNVILATRKVFTYGIITMIPFLFLFDFRFGLERMTNIVNPINILFLGVVASAICFVTWNLAIETLGVVKTSAYIYLVPAITVIFSAIFLNEKITFLGIVGVILTISGLVISENIFKKKVT